MTKHEAHTVLNAARAGLPITRAQITQALLATGDMSPTQPTPPRDGRLVPAHSFGEWLGAPNQ